MNSKKYIISIIALITYTTCAKKITENIPIFFSETSPLQQLLSSMTLEPLEYTNKDDFFKKFKKNKKKEWTICLFISADNNLAGFARKNLKQLTDIGSSDYCNIVVHLDTKAPGNRKITRRYYVEKNQLVVLNHNDPKTEKMDSGNPETLINFLEFTTKAFPSNKIALGLWNHGSGALDIIPKRVISTLPLFTYNPHKNIIELDRKIPFLEFVAMHDRAICFDDTTGHSLSNQDLIFALDKIQKQYLQGKKFNLIFFDACLMSMIEIAIIMKNYADYMAASQEVVLGPGYNYHKILSPIIEKQTSTEDFIRHIVYSYEQFYSTITNDYTQSAIDLQKIDALTHSLNTLSLLIIEALKVQKDNAMTNIIKTSRHKTLCTHFDEPSYIDLHHFCKNLLKNTDNYSIPGEHGKNILTSIKETLQDCIRNIERAIIANATGKNLPHAAGISIYFPERHLHSSYQKTLFAQQNAWYTMLKQYLLTL